MNRTLARLLVRLYPRSWQARYGEEFIEFLESGPGNLRASMNVLVAALSERLAPTVGVVPHLPSSTMATLRGRPDAFLPLAMSLAALLVVFLGPVVFGDRNSTDEGPTAHLWQILIAGQAPLLAFFALKWLGRDTKRALHVLAVHAGALLANLLVVFLLGVG